MAQTVTPTKRVELIHSRYSLKPILYERVYPPEYEMAHNRRFGPRVDPDCHPKAEKAAPKPDAVSSRQLYSEAFKTISDFINTEMIQNNKDMLVSSVQDLYEAEYCSLGGREDDIAVYSIQALTRKLKDTFEEIILLSNYTKRQGNFLYSSSMSKVDARPMLGHDFMDNPLANIKKFDCALLPSCTKTLQNKIRRTHYVRIMWGNAEASTPTDGLDTEKYGWKMENGCLVPNWFDGPVIPADLFHDKEDTDVDTGDQQAVDDAEYDDGSSTDSEWSDDSSGSTQGPNRLLWAISYSGGYTLSYKIGFDEYLELSRSLFDQILVPCSSEFDPLGSQTIAMHGNILVSTEEIVNRFITLHPRRMQGQSLFSL
ncbi:hypothetical protein GQR58_016708 [Nymphon striatum]|nr:hypothetical protein GQR58_016708 [Nymphon striatum]